MRRQSTIAERGVVAVKPLVIPSRTIHFSYSCGVFAAGFIFGVSWILWLLLW